MRDDGSYYQRQFRRKMEEKEEAGARQPVTKSEMITRHSADLHSSRIRWEFCDSESCEILTTSSGGDISFRTAAGREFSRIST